MNKRPGEFELIETYFGPLAATEAGSFGLKDDAALLAHDDGHATVVTTDAMVEGVHFLATDPPADIAAKLLRVNLSDLAAMGAAPTAYILVLALDADWRSDWLEAFAAGLADTQEEFGLSLIGGDTVSTPGPKSLVITAFGRVRAGRELRRSGARAGDELWVSGTLGDAALGLAVQNRTLAGLAAGEAETLIQRLRRPQPRISLGRRLVGLAHGAIDISDGLLADAGHLCRASGLGAEIHAHRLPLSAITARVIEKDGEWLSAVLTGGEDYELLFAAAAGDGAGIRRIGGELGLRLTVIGHLSEDAGLRVIDARGAEIKFSTSGFRHF